MKDTKNIQDIKKAIKAQGLNVEYYVCMAKSIVRELEKEQSDRGYVYDKLNKLKELEKF